MKGQYILISTKYTYPDSAAFTLWGMNSSGYCWWQVWAGMYTDKQAEEYKDHDSVFPVEYDKVRDLFETAIYCKEKIVSYLPNNKKTRGIVGIKKSQLKGGMGNITKEELCPIPGLKLVPRREQ